MSVVKAFNEFGRYLIQQSRTNLTKGGKKDQGTLYDSLSFVAKKNKNSYEFSFFMEDYGDFVDKGVKGTKKSEKAPQSPYKFGTGTGRKGGLTEAIQGWVRRNRIQFRDKKSGRFSTYDSTAYLITRSIWLTGLKSTAFYSKPFERAFERLPDDIVIAYGLEVDKLLQTAINNAK